MMSQKNFRLAGLLIGLGILMILGAGCSTQQTETEIVSTPVPTTIPTNAPLAESFRDPHPILGDVRVRQAIAYCTDRAALVQSVYPWLIDTEAYIAESFARPGTWAYTGDEPSFTHYPFDPARGQALLDEAGWKSGDMSYRVNVPGDELALKLTTSNSTFRQTWAAVWEEQLVVCGIRLLRFHTPASWFFGAHTGLARRDFEIAAFAWVTRGTDLGGLIYDAYACDRIPASAHNWQGQNYSGWCNATADAAILTALTSLERGEQLEAYKILQREFTRDLPSLPLFYRVDMFAVAPQLENFLPPEDGIHTWNAAQWRIPDQDTIVIGAAGEPASLSPFENAYVSDVIGTLIDGRAVVQRDGEYIPVLLKQIPTLQNGIVQAETVTVKEGETVVDVLGELVQLTPGAVVLDAEGRKINYTGGGLTMRRLIVTYEFVAGLTWSDGEPVVKEDYELTYRAMCDSALRGEGPFTPTYPDPFPACDQIASVDFLSDAAYRVTWLPGSPGATRQQPYFLPPFSRVPAHQVLSDGRQLSAVPFSQWNGLDEVIHSPLGVGPYVIKEWVYGERIVLEVNPHYFHGAPATPHIIVRFLEHDAALRALLAGEVDVLDWETIGPPDIDAFELMQAQADGKVRLILTPSSSWEHVDFALYQR